MPELISSRKKFRVEESNTYFISFRDGVFDPEDSYIPYIKDYNREKWIEISKWMATILRLEGVYYEELYNRNNTQKKGGKEDEETT